MLSQFKTGYSEVDVDVLFGDFKEFDGGYITEKNESTFIVRFALAKAAKSAYLSTIGNQAVPLILHDYLCMIPRFFASHTKKWFKM